jgi:hypothetical protein
MDRGQLTYEAYFKYSNGRSLISGQPLPKWQDQADNIRFAWAAAEQAAQDAVTTVKK